LVVLRTLAAPAGSLVSKHYDDIRSS